jgi:TolB-like protein/Tfp pilus assembly protein PilF
MSEQSGFFQELKRRNVVRVGVVYLVTAWLLAQVADLMLESFDAPGWVIQAILVVLIIGFPLALVFAWAFELTPEGLKKEKDVDRSQSIARVTGRKLDRAMILILVIALGYFVWESRVQHRHLEEAKPSAAELSAEAAGAAAEPAPKSIAVLPFVNMSSDPEQEYFSDGISEEILNSLAKVKDLKVAGRTSSFAFKGQNQDLRQIGDTLGVEHILEGSVRKSGATVRITAQLIQVDDGFHLWSETFDRELTDVFAIQDEIANAILSQLKAHLVGPDAAADVTAARTDSQAYDLYLLARQRMYERTGPNIQSAVELLDRAAAIDPGYAPAHAQLGIATLLLAEGAGAYGDLPLEQALTQGKQHLDRALQLDPELGEAWAGLGLYHNTRPLGAEEAIAALRKALELNSGLMDARNWLHNALQQLGRPTEARQVVMDMVERDPLYRPGIRNAVNSFNAFGEYDQALAYLERIQPLIPNDAVIQSSVAAVQLNQGQVAEALQGVEAAVALQPTNSVARLTRSFAWMSSHQWQRVANEGEEWTRVWGLVQLGRSEEAAMLAWQGVEKQADVGTWLAFLNATGRSPEAVAFIEERWSDLDALERDYPPYGGLGHLMMLDVALAYSRAGNQQRFDDALARVRRVSEELQAQGIDNPLFFMSEASHQALAGNLEASLEWLDRAISRGWISPLRIAQEWPSLEPLEGDPRYEAIRARMIEHLNIERAELGLEPLST